MTARNITTSARLALALTLTILVLTLTGCGSGQNRLPQDVPPQTIVHQPPPPVNAPRNPLFNTDMIGQTWTFYTADGTCETFVSILAPPPNNFYPQGTMDEFIQKPGGIAGAACYWLGGIPGAAIHFNLTPDEKGRFYSKGFTQIYDVMVNACPSPCTQELKQTAGTTGTPYMIVARPDLPDDQPETIGPTAYDQYNAPGQTTWDDITNPLSFHAGNQAWSTTFETLTDDIPDTWAGRPVLWKQSAAPGHKLKCSNQKENFCGHERHCSVENVGLVRIEMFNDGGPNGDPDHKCVGLGLATIIRTSF